MELWEQQAVELEENIKRQDLTWFEQNQAVANVQRLYESHIPGWTQEMTAAKLGVSVAKVSRDIAMVEAAKKHPEVATASSQKAAQRIISVKEHAETLRNNVTADRLTALSQLVVNDDARNYIRTLPTASIDLCLTDVPYGADYYNMMTGRGAEVADSSTTHGSYDDSWDTAVDLLVDLVPEILRVVKPTGWIVMMTGDFLYPVAENYLTHCCVNHLAYAPFNVDENTGLLIPPMMCNIGTSAKECAFLTVETPRWIWYKANGNSRSRAPELHAENRQEPLVVCNRGEGQLMTPFVSNVLVHDVETDRIDAMQKPIALGKDIINRLTVPGATVLDPCFGSGNLLAAAAILGRRPMGCELVTAKYETGFANVLAHYIGG